MRNVNLEDVYKRQAFAYVDESAEASKVETTQTEQSTDKEEKKDEATNTNEVRCV